MGTRPPDTGLLATGCLTFVLEGHVAATAATAGGAGRPRERACTRATESIKPQRN